MKTKLVAFGIAKDILNTNELVLELKPGTQIQDLKNELVDRFPDFEKLRSLRFAINEDYQTDDYQISENEEVVIIPPVSGG